MNNIFSGRVIFVIVVTILSLVLVWPTAQYFAVLGTMSSPPTAEQEERKLEMLKGRSMIKLGLDLQGGADMLLEVNTGALTRRAMQRAQESLRREFSREDISAQISYEEEANVITVQLDNPTEDSRIAADILSDLEFRETLTPDDLNNLATGVLSLQPREERAQEDRQAAVEAALRTVRRRVDEFGLTQPNVALQPPNRIRVQIPGETDTGRIADNLRRAANLEFRMLHPDHDTLVRQFMQPGTEVYGTGVIKDEFIETWVDEVSGEERSRILPDVPGVPPGYALFLGTERRTSQAGQVQETRNLVYILRDAPDVTGENLRRAVQIVDPGNFEADSPHMVSLEFDLVGTERFAEITTDNVGGRFAIMLDGVVFSAPVINEPILYGRAQISGSFTQEEARDLSLVLKAGALPAPLEIVEQNTIGASLGEDSVKASGYALMLAGILLTIFMIFVYRTAGFMAILAMGLNVLLIMAILSMMDATLTLSGIGGILLTMGMAVDANVLIYERLREELATGKPVKAAIATAFEKAFSVIVDSNITSLLPALVLVLFEVVDGSVRGFWVALAIGLMANIYTGLTVTRALVETWVIKYKKLNVGTFRPFAESAFDFMKPKRVTVGISAALMVVAVVFMGFNGVNPGIDFTGGVLKTVRVNDDSISRIDLAGALAGDEDVSDVRVVQVVSDTSLFQVTAASHGTEKSLEDTQDHIGELLIQAFGERISIESSQGIDPAVGREFQITAFWTLFVASLIILAYIAMRFEWVFGAAAIMALMHDLALSLGIFLLLGRSMTLDIASALLIVLGYSVNNTIVIFDRIRENREEMYGRRMTDIVNTSVNQTLTRTIFTSTTTLVAVTCMLLFGGVGLSDFALILLFGIIAGTYSSIFVSSALVNIYFSRREKKEGLDKVHGRTKTVKIGA
jgi:SecD/SecF fusion protein